MPSSIYNAGFACEVLGWEYKLPSRKKARLFIFTLTCSPTFESFQHNVLEDTQDTQKGGMGLPWSPHSALTTRGRKVKKFLSSLLLALSKPRAPVKGILGHEDWSPNLFWSKNQAPHFSGSGAKALWMPSTQYTVAISAGHGATGPRGCHERVVRLVRRRGSSWWLLFMKPLWQAGNIKNIVPNCHKAQSTKTGPWRLYNVPAFSPREWSGTRNMPLWSQSPCYFLSAILFLPRCVWRRCIWCWAVREEVRRRESFKCADIYTESQSNIYALNTECFPGSLPRKVSLQFLSRETLRSPLQSQLWSSPSLVFCWRTSFLKSNQRN